MQGNKDISTFFVAGINYKKTEAAIRGDFAINSDQYSRIFPLAAGYGVNEFFILSTCNRTEIYGFADSADHLIALLCSQTTGDIDTFKSLAYIKCGMKAIDHIFNVGGGLDSQILGDYEIVGQLKQAVIFSKQHGFIGSFLERLMNGVLQSSKSIKNKTALSGGTVSVSFAAVQYIRNMVPRPEGKKILLLGIGKIGRITCKNLVDYLGTRNITLINRTPDKAEELADELGLQCASFDYLEQEISKADIIVIATNAPTPTIQKQHFKSGDKKVIIDLSIPYNVETTVTELPGIELINVDELSKMKDETIRKRQAEVPKAKAIISIHITEFIEWNEMRRHVPVLKAVKIKLEEIYSGGITFNTLTPSLVPATSCDSRENIQKVINVMAMKMRRENQKGCHYIEAINDFMARL
jgi:glutamyl-tRNA reductase